MLRRCLSVRGLPQKKSTPAPTPTPSQDENDKEGEAATEPEGAETEKPPAQAEYDQEDIHEFVAEERVLADRRFIGSNATLIIGNLLSDPKVSDSLGMRWRIFLMTGLGRAVHEWEDAGALLAAYAADTDSQSP